MMETQIWCLPVSSVFGVGSLIKGTVASASNFAWQKAAPLPTLTLILDNSVPPSTSLVPFKLLPQGWSSEGVSPSKSESGPFERKPLFHSPTIPAGFLQPEVVGTCLSGTGTLG